VEVDSGNLALGVWTNFPLKDKVFGQSDPEIDPYGSYTLAVNDTFSVQPGFTWYNYPNGDTGNGFFKSTFEPNIALNYTVNGVKLTPKVYYDVVLKGPTYELTIAYAIPLKDAGTELDWTLVVALSRSMTPSKRQSFREKLGQLLFGRCVRPFTINAKSKLILGVAYTKGDSNFLKQGTFPKAENPAAVGRGVVTLSYAYTF